MVWWKDFLLGTVCWWVVCLGAEMVLRVLWVAEIVLIVAEMGSTVLWGVGMVLTVWCVAEMGFTVLGLVGMVLTSWCAEVMGFTVLTELGMIFTVLCVVEIVLMVWGVAEMGSTTFNFVKMCCMMSVMWIGLVITVLWMAEMGFTALWGKEMVMREWLCVKAKLVWMDIKEQSGFSLLESNTKMKIMIAKAHLESDMQDHYGGIAVLKEFLMDPPKEFVEDGNLELLNSLASEVVSILTDFHLNTLDLNMTVKLCMSLIRINLHRRLNDLMWKGRSYLVELEVHVVSPMIGQLEFVDHLVENLEELVIAKADSVAPLKFIILKLTEKLQYMSSHLMVMSQEHKEQHHLKNLLKRITTYAYNVSLLVDDYMVREHPIWYHMLLLIDELDNVQNCERQLRTELGDMPHIESKCARFHSDGFQLVIDPRVVDRHETLLQLFDLQDKVRGYEVHSWCVCSSYRERKKEVLLQLLNNASNQPLKYSSNNSQDDLETSVRELLIHRWSLIILEDVQDIDTVHDIIRVLPSPGYRGCIYLGTRSPELAAQCGYPLQKFLCNKYSQVRTIISATNLRSTDCNGGDVVVGFKEEMATMLELLTGEPKKLHLISIFGMAGLGKTTLAKKLYNDRLVIEHFDIRAWCYVSQVYETKKLLLELLRHIVQISDTISHMDDGDLADLLRKSLLGRRFIIVLDDIWSIGAWNDLRRCFPNDKNGSRVIYTTRLQGLASKAQFGSKEQPLGYLSDNESWELLRKNLSCPEELLEIGIQIAERCNGLPISLVLVAGVLDKTEKTKDRWTRILESLTVCILDDANEHAKGIIEMSYMHLPDYLKPCFLYFGHFLRDREVSVSKMIRMLIAEGLIRHSELRSLENVAEDCLMDLISRSLVTISHKKSNGGVKSCRVHDLIHEFCLSKAKEEKFLQINGYNDHFPSSDNYDFYGIFPKNYFSAPIIYDLRCVCSKQNNFIMLKPSGPGVRSLSFLSASDTLPSYPYDVSFISHNFKHLIKLDLEDINIGESFNAIMMLVHLRYLAVQGYVDCIPSSIANLWKLETFLVKGLRSKVVEVPDAICDMVKLRHVHINGSASFKLDQDRSEESSILNNLQTLSTPIVTHGGDMEKMLKRVKGIKKLKCVFLDLWDDTTNCNMLPKLGFLSQLVSLNVTYNGIGKSLCEFDFPSNLTKLTLLNFRKPWSEISQLAKLENLEVLKLLSNAFEGKTWKMENEVFSELKFLKLDTLDVEEWIANDDHFPLLEHLILNTCEQLEEIPLSIGDINTLKKIEVMWCKQSVAVSARNIQNEQMDYDKVVKIHVHPDVGS